MNSLEALFSPVSLGPVTLKNRFVLAPLTNLQSHPNGDLSDEEFEWLKKRAEGQFSMILSCAAHVSQEAQAWPGELGVFDDRQIPGLKRLAQVFSEQKTLGIAQLFHGGFRCPTKLTGVQPISASAFDPPGNHYDKPRAASEGDINKVVQDYVAAAKRVLSSNWTGVEIHGANGYIFSQFLSQTLNQRKDDYGGSIENRARLLLKTVKEVRSAIGPQAVLGVRLSPETNQIVPGIDLDETLQVAKWLAELGAHYVHLSLSDVKKFSDKYGKSKAPVVSLFREALPKNVALMAAGGVWTLEDASKGRELGLDLLALGSAAIANHDWPAKALAALKSGMPFQPQRFPLSEAQLLKEGLSKNFIDYIRPRFEIR